MRRVACLIINWNGSRDTVELAASLQRQRAANLSLDLFVVDNASAETDRAHLTAALSEAAEPCPVTIIENETNQGVPTAYNQAIARAGPSYDYYLRLDNDVVLLPGALQRLIDGLERHRADGIRLVGGNIKYFDRPAENNGGAVTFDLVRGVTHVAYPPTDTVCDGVLGCVMLLDREVITALGPEVFCGWLFLTTDESELSLRCAKRQWRTLYLSGTVAFHKGGRSTSKVASLSTFYSCRNWSYLTIRYAPGMLTRTAIEVRLAATSAYMLLTGRLATARALLIGGGRALTRIARGR